MENPFLKNFIRMRQNLHKAESTGNQSVGANKKKVSNDVPTDSISLSTIIEEKPKDSVVIEYFKRRCEQLNVD